MGPLLDKSTIHDLGTTEKAHKTCDQKVTREDQQDADEGESESTYYYDFQYYFPVPE